MKLVDRIVLIAIAIAGILVIGTPTFAALPSPVQDIIIAMATAVGTLLISGACIIVAFLGFCWILFE